MRTAWQWIEIYGVPQALYTDKKSVFITDREPTLEEQLANEKPLTTFGKACKKLGVEIIPANSPQAKGRVERKHGVLQDRFVAELALAGVKTITSANRILQEGFMQTINNKFSQPPLNGQDFHRPIPASVALTDVFCFEEERTLANDWTIRHSNHYYQITCDNNPLPKPRQKILMRWRLDGTLILLYRGRPLHFEALTPRQHDRAAQKAAPLAEKSAVKPASTTTRWRQNCKVLFPETGSE